MVDCSAPSSVAEVAGSRERVNEVWFGAARDGMPGVSLAGVAEGGE